MKKLDSEMNRFHSQKLVEETDGLEKGRLNSKRRQTILREKNIAQILTEFEGLTQAQKIDGLQFHLLKIGTLTKDNLSSEYFEVLAPLTEISTETELSVSPICIDPSSFLDETLCSVPDLEEILDPDSTNFPSFLGQNYENRDYTRVLRSNRKLRSSFHRINHFLLIHLLLNK